MGNAWIAIAHRSKSLGLYLPIYTGNVLLKFGFDAQSHTGVNSPETEKCNMAAILKATLLTINSLLAIHTRNLLLKFGLDIQSQTEVEYGKIDRLLSIHTSNLLLKFGFDIQTKLKLEFGN